MIRAVMFGVITGLSATTAQAFDYNDCILQGMKGVSGDAAVAAVRNACRQKSSDATEASERKFGESIETDFLSLAGAYSDEGPGQRSIVIQNKHPRYVVTFLRLSIYPAPGGPGTPCDGTKVKYLPYKLTLKAQQSTKLVYPSASKSECLLVAYALAREPSWTDVSLSSSVQPLDRDPIE